MNKNLKITLLSGQHYWIMNNKWKTQTVRIGGGINKMVENLILTNIIMAPKGGHIHDIVISVSVRYSVCSLFRSFVRHRFCWRVVLCVHFSSETTRPISPMMIPINWRNNVDLQHTLHFDLDPSMTAGLGHEILWFCKFRCLTVVVCVRFSSETTRPISPMMTPINWGNNVDVQCTPYFDLDPSMTAGQGHKIYQFCEFRLLS